MDATGKFTLRYYVRGEWWTHDMELSYQTLEAAQRYALAFIKGVECCNREVEDYELVWKPE